MNMISGAFLAITIFTGFLLGQSAVGIHPFKSFVKSIVSVAATVFLFTAFQFFTDWKLESGFIYILLLPVLIWYIRTPVLQSGFAILLGWTYHIAIINLTERNLFEIAMVQAGLRMDPFIELMIELFILMNNVLVLMWVFRMKPVLLPSEVFKRTISENEKKLTYRSTLITSAILLIVMGVFFQYTYYDRQFFTTAYRLFNIGWSLVLLVILLYYMKTSLSQKLKQDRFYLDQQYQQDMLSFFTVIRSQRHDFNFHLTSIYGLLKKKEYDEAGTYIGQVVQQVQNVNELLPLAHPAMSALLNTQSELAKQKGIEIHYSIFDDLRDLPVSVYDANKILGNLIQNAMEELDSIPIDARELRVEISKENKHYIFRIANRTTADESRVTSMFQTGYTTKASHEGIGLAGVERIVAAHYGIVFPELQNDWLTIHVRIPENTENY